MLTKLVSELPRGLGAWLHKYTGGNPFFIMEALKILFETGALQAKNNQWEGTVEFWQQEFSLDLSPAVKDIVSRRVTLLSEQTQRVLTILTILQENFKPQEISQLTGLSIMAVLAAFDELELVGIITQTSFTHDLLRQSIYESLSLTRRTFLHKQVAEYLTNQTQSTKTKVELALIAEHWFLAGEIEKAAQGYFKAAAKLRDLGLYFEGISLLEAKLIRVPEGLWCQRCKALLLNFLQSTKQVDKVKKLIEEFLPKLIDPWALATTLSIKTEHLHADGKLKLAKKTLRQAKGLAPDDDYTLRLHLIIIEIAILHSQSKYQEGIDLLEVELANIAKDLHPADHLTLKITYATLYDALGKYKEVQDLHLKNLQEAKMLRAPLQQVDAALNLLYNYIVLDNAEEGIELVTSIVEQNYPNSDDLQLNLAAAFRKLGRYQEALECYQGLVTNSSSNRIQALALARVIMLDYKLENQDHLEVSLKKAISCLENIDFPLALARLSIAVLEFGDSKYELEVKNILQKVDMTDFPEAEFKKLEKLIN